MLDYDIKTVWWRLPGWNIPGDMGIQSPTKNWGLTRNVLANSHICCRIWSFTRNTLLLDRKFLLATGIFYRNPSCYSKFLPVAVNFFLWQYISSCSRKFILVTSNAFIATVLFLFFRPILCSNKRYPKIPFIIIDHIKCFLIFHSLG